MLSYDGPEDSRAEEKIGRVKKYVAEMNAILEASQQVQLEEAKLEQEMRIATSHSYEVNFSLFLSLFFLKNCISLIHIFSDLC